MTLDDHQKYYSSKQHEEHLSDSFERIFEYCKTKEMLDTSCIDDIAILLEKHSFN